MSRLSALMDRTWLWLALLFSAPMLAIAHAFEVFGGLAPCHMCLQQRQAYWAAMAIAVFGIAAGRAAPRFPLRGWTCALLAAAFLAGGVIALRQAGAEWHWWPGPASCSGAASVTAADIAELMRGGGAAAPSCDVAAWRMAGVSMAGWNALASATLAGLSAWAALLAFRASRR